MLHEPQLFTCVLSEGASAAIMRYESFELSAKVVALNQIGHVTTLTGPCSNSEDCVDVVEIISNVVEALD